MRMTPELARNILLTALQDAAFFGAFSVANNYPPEARANVQEAMSWLAGIKLRAEGARPEVPPTTQEAMQATQATAPEPTPETPATDCGCPETPKE